MSVKTQFKGLIFTVVSVGSVRALARRASRWQRC